MKFGVSVWIPNRNHSKTLGAAIYSAVKEQPIEVLVIDDASTDPSMRLIYAASKVYHQFGYVQHREKSDCWEQAACPYILNLKGQHIISLSADDELCPGVCLSAMRHQQAAVIFHAYAVRKPKQQPHGIIQTFIDSEEEYTPEQVRDRFLSPLNTMETGIGSAIRHDWQQWLIEREYWRMGPYADAIGFATVAAIAGAVYVPSVGAIFTEDEHSYGSRERSGDRQEWYANEVRAFVRRAELPHDVAEAICRKRGIAYA